jgi:lysophospholipase L1-like esterase
MKHTMTLLCLAATLAALPVNAQVDFTTYVALGDSLTAGFSSNSLHVDYQERSYPAMLAMQAGAPTFEQPLVAHPGLGPILELVSLVGPVILPTTDPPPANPYDYFLNVTYPYPYNNLAVPGSTVLDLLATTGDINDLVAGNVDNVMHDLILRFPEAPHPADPSVMIPAPAIAQAIALNPSFVTLWIGNSDILSAAIYATPFEGVTMRPADHFAALYAEAVGALMANTSADIVLLNIPYCTDIPYVATVDPFVDVPGVGRLYLVTENGQLTDADMVTLGAAPLIEQGYGIPGTGLILPDDLNPLTGEPGYVLRPDEVATINERIDEYNAAIDAVASANGLTVLDINHMFTQIVNGEYMTFGGWFPTADFLLGGVFSYDGIHPQNIGYALVAMELIDHINEVFGTSIPQLNFEQILCEGGCDGQGDPDIDKAHVPVLSLEASKAIYDSFPLLGDPSPPVARRGRGAIGRR